MYDSLVAIKQVRGCSHARPDPFFDLVKQCKEYNLPGGRRSISIDSSPSCVLTLDSQLFDLRLQDTPEFRK